MNMADDQSRGRKPRNYYVDYTKQGNRSHRGRRDETGQGRLKSRYSAAPDISFGLRGFLVTSVDEVKSYLEMRNIFEEYFEQVYQVANVQQPGGEKDKQGDCIEDELEQELKYLKRTRPFKQVKTHCRNTLFINILPEFPHVDPVEIVDRFFDDLLEKRQLRCTNTYKIIPIMDTFRSSVACAKESINSLLKDKFSDQDSKKYFIEFQSRGNYKLNPEDKQNMIEGIAQTVSEIKPEWKVDRDNADYIIVLVALKNVCCVSFLKKYFQRSKYNVIELCKDFDKPSDGTSDQGCQESTPQQIHEERSAPSDAPESTESALDK